MEPVIQTSSNTIPPKYQDFKCQELHEPYPCHIDRGDVGPTIPTRYVHTDIDFSKVFLIKPYFRLIGPDNLVSQVLEFWKVYIPLCLESAYELLGPHPFSKLDIVIVPRCYSGLGLASPSLMFISQSVILNCDAYMSIRLSHEISHNWFGLVIGALDWTEEWLSEVRKILVTK